MSLARFVGKMRLSMRNHSPQIMFVGGTLAMGAAIVEAFKARPKYEEVMDEYRQKSAQQKRAVEIADAAFENGEDIYPAERRLGDKIHDGLVTGMKLAVVFGKVLAFGGIALGCFFGYGRIYKGWFLGAAAVAEGTSRKLKALEAATVAEVGKDKMQDIKDRMFKEEAEKRYNLDEDGKRTIKDVDMLADHPSFSKWFDDSNKDFKKGDPDANLNYLLNKLELLNIRLQARGYLMANEVFQEMKMQKTPWGQIYGILAENEDGTKNYLDFGLYNGKDPAARNFINGLEDVFLVNFNFDPNPIVGRVKEFTNLPY